MCIYCTLDHSLQAVAVIFVLIRSGLCFIQFRFRKTQLSEKNEVNRELTVSDANTRPVLSSFAWLGVKRKKLVWIIGVVFRPNGLISIDNVF